MPSVIYNLVRHPRAMEKALQEVRSISTDADISHQRLRDVPFLSACIQETMRMHPPVPGGLPRVVPVNGQEISGYWMPPKTAVQVTTYAAYRSPLNFQYPDAFIPERWITGAPESRLDQGRGVFRPFSTGPRNCIGQNFALAEMRMALAKLLWHFDVTLTSNDDWFDQRCWLLWVRNPLMVRLQPRFGLGGQGDHPKD